MEKYSFELKCQVVQDYLSGVGSIAFIANKYSIPAKSNVEKWINLYNSQGIEVLKTGKGRSEYPFSFKKHVVELYLSTKKSYQTLACSFGMKDPSLICKWVKKYQTAGFDALKTRKERVQDFMQEKQLSANKQDNDSDYILKLEEENLKLKIENAYLKELRRLRLEEETLLKKQRELSTASEESSNERIFSQWLVSQKRHICIGKRDLIGKTPTKNLKIKFWKYIAITKILGIVECMQCFVNKDML